MALLVGSNRHLRLETTVFSRRVPEKTFERMALCFYTYHL